MKKVSCLILSFIMVFSAGSVNVMAAEDTGEEYLYEDVEEEDIILQEYKDAADLTDDKFSAAEIEEDESDSEISEEDESLKEIQNTDEGADEIELLAENLEDAVDSEWTEITISSLEYDDRYSLEDLSEISGADEKYVISEIVSDAESYQVVSGEITDTKDEVITQKSEDSLDIIATGVGTASIYLVPVDAEGTNVSINDMDPEEDSDVAEEPGYVENGIKVNVTVEPATLTLMYLTGQSNMEGRCSDSTGDDLDASVACPEGAVYSTYAPTNSNSDEITGINFTTYCDVNNVDDFVAGSLQSDFSISGKNLEYSLSSLTVNGNGKTGPDSGLAYEWNRLTGDKVWVINTAWSGTGIASWIPGATQYKRSAAAWDCVKQVYQAELSAGHYIQGSKLAFWLQGESDTQKTTEDYISDFTNMHTSMKKELGLDAFGIIMVRASSPGDTASGAYTTEKDLKMSNPRIAQYVLGGSGGLSDVYVVSNVNEQWVSDAGVKSYFEEAYSNGSLGYPMHESSKSTLPETVKEVHSNVHYSQVGHNENGITAANGMYQVLEGTSKPINVEWRNEDGKAVTSLSMDSIGGKAVLVAVANPVYAAKGISYSVFGDAVSYDSSIAYVSAKAIGTSEIRAIYNGETISKISLKVSEGVIQYGNDWWYVKDGEIDYSYTGFAQNENGWWYIENGRVTFNRNSVIQDINKKIDGTASWWYVVGSKVQNDFTGLADYSNSNGWWYINDGKVTFDVDTVAKNKNGWYYVKDSKVDFNYSGFADNNNGWWYIEDGKVTFNKNSVIQGKIKGINAWWYVVDSKAQLDFTGLADYSNSNGWWYINDGKVTFDENTVAKNKNGWYYVEDSKVIFSYSGYASNSNGWWYIENGRVTFNKNSVIKGTVKETNAWWYVVGSKVQTDFTGLADYSNSNGWWYVKNGKVDFTTNTVAKNKNGWYYILDGKVQTGFTGLADYSNSNGWWYINNGKVTFNVNTVAKNKNGWYYVKNSKVDFGFNGISSNKNGSWYIREGKVDFTYNGTCNYNGKKYTIINGKVY